MSVNLTVAINPKKTKHLGPIYHTIDFDFDSGKLILGDRQFKLKQDDVQELIYQCNERWLRGENKIEINGYEVNVTKKEIERISETCENIKRIAYQRFRFFGR